MSELNRHTNVLAIVVCEALGIDPHKVVSIELRFHADEVPRAKIEYLAVMRDEKTAAKAGRSFSEYELVPKRP